MGFRARFAPSPTGQVHIGNIRTAIFNWLCARHNKGVFLLRIEDTDLERSTKEAIDTLIDCMNWLGLDYDEEPMYQTKQLASHHIAAEKLLEGKYAYKLEPDADFSPVYFRIPYDCSMIPFVRETGTESIKIAPETIVALSRAGVNYSTLSTKGKVVENQACLAGFKNLRVLSGDAEEIFALNDENISTISDNIEPLLLEGAAELVFTRREVFYTDMVKGELAKPLDSIKDFIIVRSDSSPVFHLANVCDDITQNVTHIVRGDDHVENTYRHLFLFHCLSATPPKYAHLPMIVNAQGKPYSKRDGDAFVGDFKEKGFLPEALFNYLALLGWSPGDNREKMSKEELVEAFNIERAQHTPAQFDMVKLMHMNGMYIASLSSEIFLGNAWDFAKRWDWHAKTDRAYFDRVASLMQSRTKAYTDIEAWNYFFDDVFAYDAKALKKFLGDSLFRAALEKLASKLPGLESECDIEKAVREIEASEGIKEGKLNQPLRIAVTGVTSGAGVYETIALLGVSKSVERIYRALLEPLES